MKPTQPIVVLLVIITHACRILNGFGQETSVPDESSIEVTRPAPGLQSMQQIEALPLLFPNGTATKQFSSYDPTGGIAMVTSRTRTRNISTAMASMSFLMPRGRAVCTGNNTTFGPRAEYLKRERPVLNTISMTNRLLGSIYRRMSCSKERYTLLSRPTLLSIQNFVLGFCTIP